MITVTTVNGKQYDVGKAKYVHVDKDWITFYSEDGKPGTSPVAVYAASQVLSYTFFNGNGDPDKKA